MIRLGRGSPARPLHPPGRDRRRPRGVAAIGIALLFAGGCFSYQPFAGASPGPGERVRIHIAGEEAARISDRVGQPISALEGRVLFADRDSLRLDVGWGGIFAATPMEGRRDTLTFTRGTIFRLERRQLSRTRSVLAGLGLAGLVYLIFQWVDDGGGGNTGTDPGGGPIEVWRGTAF